MKKPFQPHQDLGFPANQAGRSEGVPPHYELSVRELHVLCMIASQHTVEEIARDTYMSVNTVKVYRSRILEKLNVESILELKRYALRHNLLK